MLRAFSPEEFQQLFTEAADLDWEIDARAETDSTMTVARQRAESGPIERPFLAIAGSQHGGRGRQGRVWSSSPGGFYATFLFSLQQPMATLGGFSLAVGVVIQSILSAAGVTVALKWPNDLLVEDGRKLGGILIEVLPSGSGSLLLVGIGINFDNPVDRSIAVSVRELGATDLTLPGFTLHLARELQCAVRDFQQNGLKNFLPAWRTADFLRGKRVEIDEGSQTVKGLVTGISDQGALLIDTPQGTRQVWSGHIISIS